MRAGDLSRRVQLLSRGTGPDDYGDSQPWAVVGELWAGIANESGLGAIRTTAQANVSAAIARYSFLVRFDTASQLGVKAGMRLRHDGFVFEVKGITRDFKERDKAYLICEEAGADG